MVAPVIAAAGIGALGSIIGGKGKSKAIRQAAEIQAQAMREQQAAIERTRAENMGILRPSMDRGERAGSLLEAVLTGGNWTRPGGMGEGGATGQGALSAFDAFRNSGNYQFRMGEGLRALNTGYAGKGVLNSGAAMRGIVDYGQQTASNELGNWMNQLLQQQQIGAGASAAATGQNVSFLNMGNQVTQNGADNASNARLMMGQNRANMWSDLAGYAGSAIGGMGKSSYGGSGALNGITTTLGNSPFKGWI